MSSNYHPTRRDLLKHSAIATVMASGITAFPFTRNAAAAQQIPRNEALYVGGMQWGNPATFNPLNPGDIWPTEPQFNLIWETLYMFNIVDGANEPLLAADAPVWEGTSKVTVTLREGILWSDGEPLTAEDVAYTYNLPATDPSVPHAAITSYVSSIEATDDLTVVFTCDVETPNQGMVNVFLQNVPIMPKHIWEGREGETLGGVVDLEPVGSGPYKVYVSSPEQTIVERRDDYWGNEAIGQPAPKYIVHPIPKSNDDTNLAFQRGEIDLSQTFMPQLWQLWEDQELPVGTWFKEQPYHLPGTIPMIHLNVHKPGLDDPVVRKALAYSIPYPLIAETAMSNYSVPVNASLVLPSGSEEMFFDAAGVEADGWTHDPAQATALLEEAGYTKNGDGIYEKDGVTLGPWTVRCPYGWTDWMTSLELVVQGAREVGFDVATEFPEAPVHISALQGGDFDIAMYNPATVSPAGPWVRFRDIFENRGVPEVGEAAFYNYNRYKNADAEALLDQAAAAETDEEKVPIYAQLDEIYRAEVPVIGLMYRPFQFFEFNAMHWEGFPTSDNPIAPPMHSGAGRRVLTGLKPTGQ